MDNPLKNLSVEKYSSVGDTKSPADYFKSNARSIERKCYAFKHVYTLKHNITSSWMMGINDMFITLCMTDDIT